jgi:hypothetical protein
MIVSFTLYSSCIMITNHKIKKPTYAVYFHMCSQMGHLTIHVKIQ